MGSESRDPREGSGSGDETVWEDGEDFFGGNHLGEFLYMRREKNRGSVRKKIVRETFTTHIFRDARENGTREDSGRVELGTNLGCEILSLHVSFEMSVRALRET